MKWEELDAQARRKTIIFAAILGGVLVVLTWPSGPVRQRTVRRAPAARQTPKLPAAQKPLPVVHAAGIPAAPNARIAAASTPFGELLGNYAGHEVLPGRGGCRLLLELRRSRDKEREFTGYTNTVCAPTLGELIAENKGKPRGLVIDARNKAMNPTVATLNGEAVEGSIKLHAVKIFGALYARGGCEITALSVTPLSGNGNTVAVEWQETEQGLCHGGQMVLNKTGR